jgi:GTP-binding protein HflX
LTKENKETSASLFTTLSTTTRSLNASHFSKDSEKTKDILLVDTVGFISRLPHYMIEAFKSTLEESLEADLILFLIDSSEELNDIGTKYSSSWNVLKDLGVDKSKLYILLTKADTAENQKLKEIMSYMEPSIEKIAISSKSGHGINKLKNVIISKKTEREKTE